MLEGIINMSGTMENATFANLVTMFDGAYKETQGRIVANNADQQDIGTILPSSSRIVDNIIPS